MGTLTIRLPDDKHERLRALSRHRGVSLTKLFEEFCTHAVAEFDVEMRFRTYAARGNVGEGLAVLDVLDKAHGSADSS